MATTVTGKLEASANATTIVGGVEVMLCGYGSRVPRVNGVALITRITTTVPVATDGTFTFTVAGNDLVAPANTYYTVTMRDDNGDIAQVNAYRFLDGNSYDLDGIEPIDPNQPPPPLPPIVTNQLIIVPPANNASFPLGQGTAFRMTLNANVNAPVFTGQLPGNLYTFILQQDATGGHTFTWPANAHNGSSLDPRGNAITIQTFICDQDLNLYAIAGATYYL